MLGRKERDQLEFVVCGSLRDLLLRIALWSGWTGLWTCPGCRSRWPIFIPTAWAARD